MAVNKHYNLKLLRQRGDELYNMKLKKHKQLVWKLSSISAGVLLVVVVLFFSGCQSTDGGLKEREKLEEIGQKVYQPNIQARLPQQDIYSELSPILQESDETGNALYQTGTELKLTDSAFDTAGMLNDKAVSFAAWLENGFSGEEQLLDMIRSSLSNKTEITSPPMLNIPYDPNTSHICITLFQAGNDPLRWITKRSTLAQTLNRIVSKIVSNKRFVDFSVKDSSKCRIMLEIVTNQRLVDINKLASSKLDQNRFEPGITGLKINYSGKTAFYMPTDATVYSHLTLNHVLNHISKKMYLPDGSRISQKTDKISERVKILKSLDPEVYLLESKAFVTYNDELLPLYRGLPVPLEYSEQTIRTMTEKSLDWMLENMLPDGRFLYYYDGVADSVIDHMHPDRTAENNYYNILRHCGGTISLLRIYEFTNNKQYIAAAKKSLDYLVRQLRYHKYKGKKAAYVFYNSKAKLGGTGVALAAMAQYHNLTGDKQFNVQMMQMARHLISRVDEHGEMIGYYIHPGYNDGKELVSPDPETKKQLFSFYYPGEALLGLALFDSYVDMSADFRKQLRDAAEKALDFLVDTRPVKYPEMFEPLPSDGWLMQAIEQWAKIERFQKPEYLDFVFTDAKKMIDHMYNDTNSLYYDYPGCFYYYFGDHAYPDGARAEGLIAAYYLAEYIGREKLARYFLNNCKTVAHSLMFTYNSPKSAYMHRFPGKSIGSFSFKLTRQWVRVDSVQHTACFYVRLLEALQDQYQR